MASACTCRGLWIACTDSLAASDECILVADAGPAREVEVRQEGAWRVGRQRGEGAV